MVSTTVPADLDAETVAQLRHERANGMTLAELRKAYPSLSAEQIKAATEGVETAKAPTGDLPKLEEAGIIETPKRTRKAPAKVETRRERPTKPVRSRFPNKAEFDKAMAAYRTALAAFEAGTAKRAGSAKAPATTTAKPKATGAKAKAERKPRAVIDPPKGFKGWDDPKLATKVLARKAKGLTIKQISAELGLPDEERFHHRVSLVFRAAADAKGIERPRLSAEAIEARRKEKAAS
jgi:hypothetical protein